MTKIYYIASWEGSNGIYSLEYDYEKNAPASLKNAASIDSATYFDRRGDVLYALSETQGPGDFAGSLHAFRMTEDGGLERIAELRGIPSGSPHLSVNGDLICTASYNNGKVSASRLLPDGGFGGIVCIHQQTGSSVRPDRQEGPHAHIMCPSPEGFHVFCCDLGTDTIHAYLLDRSSGRLVLKSSVKTPAGYGPRHMVFSTDGRFAYVVCELQYHVLTFEYDGAAGLKLVDDLKVIENLPEDRNWGGAIKLSADGCRLFVTNRPEGLSSIDILSLEDPSHPRLIGTVDACDHPRDFLLTTDGAGRDILIALSMTGNVVRFFEYSPESLEFRLLSEIDGISKPVCILEK